MSGCTALAVAYRDSMDIGWVGLGEVSVRWRGLRRRKRPRHARQKPAASPATTAALFGIVLLVVLVLLVLSYA